MELSFLIEETKLAADCMNLYCIRFSISLSDYALIYVVYQRGYQAILSGAGTLWFFRAAFINPPFFAPNLVVVVARWQ